jgi:diphthine-ammonia ligase
MRVAISWSGGKDSCLACFKATQEGFEVHSLLTMMTSDGKSNFHLIKSDLLDAQADSLRIPMTKQKTAPGTYEQEFRKALIKLKTDGVKGLVTGDIYEVPMHESGWLDRICREADLKPIKPLWNRDTRQIFHEFINSDFQAVVIRVNTALLGSEWLGRQLNEKFFEDIVRIGNVDPCGERGEYHTLVTDGPLFNKHIEILESRKATRNGSSCLEIEQFEVNEKSTENYK